MIFEEEHKAKIEVKRIMLGALKDNLRKLRPIVDHLELEIRSLNHDIKRLEKEASE